MLCQFTFWNYKPYRDEVTLDLCPARITEHEDRLIVEPITKERFLPLAVIYGPNGGGKSAVIDSYRFLRDKVLEFALNPGLLTNQSNGEQKTNGNILKTRFNDNISFKFDNDSVDSPSGWKISFITAGYEYKYTLVIGINEIVEESLYARELKTGNIETLFERGDDIILGDSLKDVNLGRISARLPLLSFIGFIYDYEHTKNVKTWFEDTQVFDYGSSINTIVERSIQIPKSTDKKNEFFSLLNSMGIEINDFQVLKDSNGEVQKMFSLYRHNDTEVLIDFNLESSGTRKVFSLLVPVMQTIQDGRTIFIDELDAKLHPKLLEFIISLFTNKNVNKNGAQLIITSHDLHTLNSEFLRRDEIWFAAKREDFSSYLYSLSDFKKISSNGKQPRKDENYAKQYIEGRYGADPYFQRLENWTVTT